MGCVQSTVKVEKSGTALACINAVRFRLGQFSHPKNSLETFEIVRSVFDQIYRTNEEDSICVDLSSLDLQDQGAILVAECLKRNENISSLELRNNGISHLGMGELAKSIRFNDKLLLFDISNNPLRPAGVASLCRWLMDNTTLQQIRLDKAGLGDAGLRQVASIILARRRVVNISLRGNEFSLEALRLLKIVIQTNCRLLSLDLDDEKGVRVDEAEETEQGAEEGKSGSGEKENSSNELVARREVFADINRCLRRNNTIADIISLIVHKAVTKNLSRRYVLPRGPRPNDLSEKRFWEVERQSLRVGTVGGREFTYSIAETIGRRPRMEDVILVDACLRGRKDEHLFGIFDGHGGVQCSRFVGSVYSTTFIDCLNEGMDPEAAAMLLTRHHDLAESCDDLVVLSTK